MFIINRQYSNRFEAVVLRESFVAVDLSESEVQKFHRSFAAACDKCGRLEMSESQLCA